MSSVPDCAWVRGYVLNKLQDGPVRVADLIRLAEAEFGFSPAEIHGSNRLRTALAPLKLWRAAN